VSANSYFPSLTSAIAVSNSPFIWKAPVRDFAGLGRR